MGAEDSRKLFVGGLAETVTQANLREVFESLGFAVEHLGLPRDRQTGAIRGFAFVTLKSEEDVARAISTVAGTMLGGRPLSLRPFQQDGRREGGGPRGRDGDGPRGGRPSGPRRDHNKNQKSLFLGKLPFEATQADVTGLFESVGLPAPTRVTLPTGPDGRPRGFGFATLADDANPEDYVAKLDGQTLGGRQIAVNEARPREERGPGGPRGGGGGGAPPRERAPRENDSAAPRGAGWDDNWAGSSMPMPAPFPSEGDDRRRRGEKKQKKDKKRGANARRNDKRERGGGSNWNRWQSDDD